MELNEIVEKMVQFEKLVDPQEMVVIASKISEFITHYELEYDDANVAYSMRWEAVKYSPNAAGEKPYSDRLTDLKMMRDSTYAHLVRTKRTLGELRRYRSDLNRKLDVIMGIKRRS